MSYVLEFLNQRIQTYIWQLMDGLLRPVQIQIVKDSAYILRYLT